MTFPNDADSDRRRATRREGMSDGTMAAIVIAAVIGIAGISYAVSDHKTTASSDRSAPATATVGQSQDIPGRFRPSQTPPARPR
jgi:cell division protein FtsN